MLLAESPSPGFAKKPRNYREWLSYVNLKAADPPVGVDHFPDRNHLNIRASGQVLNALLDLTCICFITNNFRSKNQCFGNCAWMPAS